MRAHLDLLSLCRAWSALPIACPLLEARARTLADRVIAANPLDADPTRPQHDYWCSLPERRCCGWFLQRTPGGPVEASAYARRVNPSGTGQQELKGGYQVFETIEQAKGWIVETAQGFALWRWNARGDLIAPE